MSAAKKLHASEGRPIDSRSAVERAIDRSKADKTRTWDEATKEESKKTAIWGKPTSQTTEQ
jgi:hypothetical protein